VKLRAEIKKMKKDEKKRVLLEEKRVLSEKADEEKRKLLLSESQQRQEMEDARKRQQMNANRTSSSSSANMNSSRTAGANMTSSSTFPLPNFPIPPQLPTRNTSSGTGYTGDSDHLVWGNHENGKFIGTDSNNILSNFVSKVERNRSMSENFSDKGVSDRLFLSLTELEENKVQKEEEEAERLLKARIHGTTINLSDEKQVVANEVLLNQNSTGNVPGGEASVYNSAGKLVVERIWKFGDFFYQSALENAFVEEIALLKDSNNFRAVLILSGLEFLADETRLWSEANVKDTVAEIKWAKPVKAGTVDRMRMILNQRRTIFGSLKTLPNFTDGSTCQLLLKTVFKIFNNILTGTTSSSEEVLIPQTYQVGSSIQRLILATCCIINYFVKIKKNLGSVNNIRNQFEFQELMERSNRFWASDINRAGKSMESLYKTAVFSWVKKRMWTERQSEMNEEIEDFWGRVINRSASVEVYDKNSKKRQNLAQSAVKDLIIQEDSCLSASDIQDTPRFLYLQNPAGYKKPSGSRFPKDPTTPLMKTESSPGGGGSNNKQGYIPSGMVSQAMRELSGTQKDRFTSTTKALWCPYCPEGTLCGRPNCLYSHDASSNPAYIASSVGRDAITGKTLKFRAWTDAVRRHLNLYD